MSDCMDGTCDGGVTDALDCECECERCTDCGDAIADCDTEDCVDCCMGGVACCADLAIKAQRKAAAVAYMSSKGPDDVNKLDSSKRDASVGLVPIVPVEVHLTPVVRST